VYSQTWRYTHPYWRAANEKEYVAGEPKNYAVDASLAQRESGDYDSFAQDDAKKPADKAAAAKKPEAKKAGAKDAKKDDKKKEVAKLDGTAWKTADFYHYNEKEYREDTPKDLQETVGYVGESLTPEKVKAMREADAKVILETGLKEAKEAAHKNVLLQKIQTNGITLFQVMAEPAKKSEAKKTEAKVDPKKVEAKKEAVAKKVEAAKKVDDEDKIHLYRKNAWNDDQYDASNEREYDTETQKPTRY
jgi:hypothetical protein